MTEATNLESWNEIARFLGRDPHDGRICFDDITMLERQLWPGFLEAKEPA